MARYENDYNANRMGLHDFAERRPGRPGSDFYDPAHRYARPRPGGGNPSGAYGGMRSDAYGTTWRHFPGEQGWFGPASPGYPGGEPRRTRSGYDRGYRPGYDQGYDRNSPGRTFASRPDRDGFRREGGGYDADFRSRSGAGSGSSDADRVRAADLMTENPETVTPDATVAEVAKKMRELDVGIIPVVESEDSARLKGVVTDRDLAIRVLAEGKSGRTKVASVMTTEVETVNQFDPVNRVFDVMKRHQVRRVPVTDRESRLVGIIAQADLAVDYAGLDLQRETEVEEVVERISEPARPRR